MTNEPAGPAPEPTEPGREDEDVERRLDEEHAGTEHAGTEHAGTEHAEAEGDHDTPKPARVEPAEDGAEDAVTAPAHVTPLDNVNEEPQDEPVPPPAEYDNATSEPAETVSEPAATVSESAATISEPAATLAEPAMPADPVRPAGFTDVPPPGSAVPPPGGVAPPTGAEAPTGAETPSVAEELTGSEQPAAATAAAGRPGSTDAPGQPGRPGQQGPTMAPTGGYAAQHGLVRPVNGRYIAGVCGALGRATNTDPVLWRVLLPVLMVVGLLGGLIYLLGWLLIPSEGDSASPFEALIGRGHSSMSRGWALALSILTAAVATSGFAIGRGGRFLLFVAIVGGAVLLVASRNTNKSRWPSTTNVRPPWAPPMAAPTGDPMSASMAPSAGVTPAPARSAHPIIVEPAPTPMTPAPTSAYQPPFAPHGPYEPYEPTSTFPTADLGTLSPVPAPRVPKPTGPRRAILSSVVLAVGLLVLLDLSNVISVPVAAYFAVALAVLGLGMIVAAFFGRVRGPITLGILLVIGLSATTAVSAFHGDYNNRYLFKPATVADLQSHYDEDTGRMTLDLSDLELTGEHVVNVHLNVGLVQITVPRDTDVIVMSHVNLGATNAFGRQRGGVGNGPFQVTDDGPDGPGGGTLEINADVNVGKVEVSR